MWRSNRRPVGSPKGFAEITELSSRLGRSPQLQVAIAAGSTLIPALAKRIGRYLGSNVISLYGTSETGPIAAGPMDTIAEVECAVGYVLPGMVVDIVDRSGKRMPPGQTGFVRILGTGFEGYIGDPELTSQRLRKDGFYPGDFGSIGADGLLKILGREGAAINLGGEKVNPEYVESVICSHKAIADAGVFGLSTSVGVQLLGAALVWREATKLDELEQFLKKNLPNIYMPVRFIEVERIPRNSAGKIQRDQLKNIAAERISEG